MRSRLGSGAGRGRSVAAAFGLDPAHLRRLASRNSAASSGADRVGSALFIGDSIGCEGKVPVCAIRHHLSFGGISMRVLVSNDDGVDAPGIRHLADALRARRA